MVMFLLSRVSFKLAFNSSTFSLFTIHTILVIDIKSHKPPGRTCCSLRSFISKRGVSVLVDACHGSDKDKQITINQIYSLNHVKLKHHIKSSCQQKKFLLTLSNEQNTHTVEQLRNSSGFKCLETKIGS